jgi:hypothetical protein
MDGWRNAGSVLLYRSGSLIIFVPRLIEDPSSIGLLFFFEIIDMNRLI